MKILDKKELTKIKSIIDEIELYDGDVYLNNQFGATILLSSDESKYSKIFLSAGRISSRPNTKNDSSCIIIHENGIVDNEYNASSNIEKESDKSSFILINADRIRLNSKSGNVAVSSQKSINLSSKDKLIVKTKNANVEITGDAIIRVNGKLDIVADKINIESKTSLNMKSRDFVLSANNIDLGGNSQEKIALADKLSLWLSSHIHISSPTGGPTSSPTTQVNFKSKKVKSN